MDSYAESRQVSAADIEKEVADEVRRSVKARFILDQLAEQENLGIEQDEIGQYITQLAYQQGVSPDQFARQLTSSGQLSAVVSDVLRSKAADLLAERVKVTDESGRKVAVGAAEDDSAAGGDGSGEDEAAAEPADRVRRGAREGPGAARRRQGAEAKDAAGDARRGRGRRAAEAKSRSRRSRKDQDPQDEAAGDEAAPVIRAPGRAARRLAALACA